MINTPKVLNHINRAFYYALLCFRHRIITHLNTTLRKRQTAHTIPRWIYILTADQDEYKPVDALVGQISTHITFIYIPAPISIAGEGPALNHSDVINGSTH